MTLADNPAERKIITAPISQRAPIHAPPARSGRRRPDRPDGRGATPAGHAAGSAPSGNTATQSISIWMNEKWLPTVVRAGYGGWKVCAYSSL